MWRGVLARNAVSAYVLPLRSAATLLVPIMKKPIWQPEFTIPSHVSLPGLRIRVRLATPDTVASLQHMDGNFFYTVDAEKPIAMVTIDSTYPLPVQRYILLHELGHAIHEEIDVMLEQYPECVMTKSMAKWRGLYAPVVATPQGGSTTA